jgi:hypothetical protein
MHTTRAALPSVAERSALPGLPEVAPRGTPPRSPSFAPSEAALAAAAPRAPTGPPALFADAFDPSSSGISVPGGVALAPLDIAAPRRRTFGVAMLAVGLSCLAVAGGVFAVVQLRPTDRVATATVASPSAPAVAGRAQVTPLGAPSSDAPPPPTAAPAASDHAAALEQPPGAPPPAPAAPAPPPTSPTAAPSGAGAAPPPAPSAAASSALASCRTLDAAAPVAERKRCVERLCKRELVAARRLFATLPDDARGALAQTCRGLAPPRPQAPPKQPPEPEPAPAVKPETCTGPLCRRS